MVTRSVTQEELVRILFEMAPPALAREGDEPGFLARFERPVERIGVCTDPTEGNLKEAARLGLDFVVSHHDWFREAKGAVQAARISLFKMHTNWDRCPEGNSVVLGRIIGLAGLTPMNYSAYGRLPVPTTLRGFLGRVSRLFGARNLPYMGDPGAAVRTVGVIAGACFSPSFQGEWEDLKARGCDTILSGDLVQSTARFMRLNAMSAVDLGHSPSERPGLAHLAELLRERLGDRVAVTFLPDIYGVAHFVAGEDGSPPDHTGS